MAARVLDAEWWESPDDARVSGYTLIREIGRGGMGAVYEALCDDSHERLAVKLVKREMATDFIIHRFRHERRILAKLKHRYIARLLDGGTTADALPYLIMEYVEGKTNRSICSRHWVIDPRATRRIPQRMRSGVLCASARRDSPRSKTLEHSGHA